MKTYIDPEIKVIQLDNEISLTLDSTPPIGPDEGLVQTDNNQELFRFDVYKSDLV